MRFDLRGTLCGALCEDCTEPASAMELCAFAADPLLDRPFGERCRAMPERPSLARALTDQSGAFTLRFDASYDGGPLALALWCRRVPRQAAVADAAAGLWLGRVDPVWRGAVVRTSRWDSCIAREGWNALRAAFDARVICGRLRGASSYAPVEGATVTALWRAGAVCERIGAARTDPAGRFRIDYQGAERHVSASAALSFRVTSSAGAPLTLDVPSLTRAWDLGPVCLCANLHVNEPVARASRVAMRRLA